MTICHRKLSRITSILRMVMKNPSIIKMSVLRMVYLIQMESVNKFRITTILLWSNHQIILLRIQESKKNLLWNDHSSKDLLALYIIKALKIFENKMPISIEINLTRDMNNRNTLLMTLSNKNFHLTIKNLNWLMLILLMLISKFNIS